MNRLHWATLIVIPIFIIGIYAYKDANIILDKSKRESYVKQDGITSIGYDNGKKVFKVHIDALTQHNYKHILYSENITNGIIYDTDQQPVIQQIRGNYGRINTRIKNIVVTNNVTAQVTPKESTKNIQVKAEHFRYSHFNKLSEFSKTASIQIQSITIGSNAFDFFTKENKIHFKDKISIISETSTTNANTATLLIDQDLLHATDNIKTIYKKQSNETKSEQIQALTQFNTLLQSNHLHVNYKTPDHPLITYWDDVNVSQPDKSLSTNLLKLNFKTKAFNASGNIKIKLDQLNWLKNNKKTYKNKKLESLLNNPTTIQGTRATFKESSNTFMIKDSVVIKQTEFNLYCDEFFFNFKTDIITASGNVKISKLGITHLETDLLIIDVKKETFQSGTKKSLSEITLEIIE